MMLKNFIKNIGRQIVRNKIYVAINITGLAISIGCGLVIFKIITFESGFDRYHKNYPNIYRLINQIKDPAGDISYYEGQVHPLGEALRNDFPGVDAAMTFYAKSGQITIENEDQMPLKFQEKTGLVYAEPTIFRIFDFEFLAGDPHNALSNTGNIVISSSLAQKYFKLSMPEIHKALGKTIIIDNKTTFQVTGIIATPPKNTDLPFQLIASYRDQTASNPYFNNGTDWNEFNSATNCYLLLPDKKRPEDFEKQLITFNHKYNGKKSPFELKYVLQPLSELHSGLCNNYNNRLVSGKKLILLGVIGLFLIVIASINFINLFTALATKRVKEIGIKKISGAGRRQLISQLMGETITMSFIAAFIGMIIAKLSFIYFEDVIGYRLDLDFLKNPAGLIFLAVTAFGVGLISGFYPSLVISGIRPAGTLGNIFRGKSMSGSIPVRRNLVIVQFAISLILIIGTLTMNRQMNYFLNKDLGFNKEAILIAKLPDTNVNHLQVLKTSLLSYPDIKLVSYATRSPLADWNVSNEINYPSLERDLHAGNLKTIDEDYLELFQLELIAGRNCDKRKDNGTAVVNRKLTNLLGFDDPNEALGEKFEYSRDRNEFTIIGVVENFHNQSLHSGMENVIFSNLSWNIKEMIVKINPATTSFSGLDRTIAKIQAEWLKMFPENIFEYEFLDQQIAGLYKEEKRTSRLVQLFASIAIIIGCLGLFGLISFITTQRIKEIGIRKVNGAKVSEILAMLNKDFVKWVAIAFVIACPIAWYVMSKWLENFAYKTTLSWWVFALAGLLALGIALLTVSWQSWRAATKNPVEALRYE